MIYFKILGHSTVYTCRNYNYSLSSGIHFAKLSLGKLQHKVDTGVLDPSKITMFDLVSQQIVNLPDDYTGIQLDIQVCNSLFLTCVVRRKWQIFKSDLC